MEFLAAIVKFLIDLFGEAAVRAACDEECAIRKGRAEADARADAKFGPKRCTACGQAVAPPDSVPPTDPSPLPEGYVR